MLLTTNKLQHELKITRNIAYHMMRAETSPSMRISGRYYVDEEALKEWVKRNTHTKSVGFKADGGRKILTVTASSKQRCIELMKSKEREWEKEKAARTLDKRTTLVGL